MAVPLWHWQAVQYAFGKLTPPRIAERVHQPVEKVEKMLAKPWAQAQLAEWHRYALQHAATQAADPIARLASKADEAAIVMVEAMELAREEKNVKQMLAAAAAILAHAGYAPEKKERIRVEGLIATITDLELLRQIKATGQVPAQLTHVVQ